MTASTPTINEAVYHFHSDIFFWTAGWLHRVIVRYLGTITMDTEDLERVWEKVMFAALLAFVRDLR